MSAIDQIQSSIQPAGGSNGLLNNLISCWELSEASGDALDSFGSDPGTDTNTVGSSASGMFGGNARDFEVDNAECFLVTDSSAMDTGDIDFTLACWVKFETLTNYRPLLTKGAISGAGEYELFYHSGSGLMRIYIATEAVGAFATNFGALSTDTWYWVCAWFDSTANELYCTVNNTSETPAATGTDAPTPSTYAVGIGAWSDSTGDKYMDGLMNQAAFWKGLLTSDQRAALYNGGSGLPFSSWTS